MAEVLGVVASVVTVVQVTDRIIGACKFYISSVRDAPSDLRAILLEVSALKTVFENLKFLNLCDHSNSPMPNSLCGTDGPIEGCLRSLNELVELFPPDETHIEGQGHLKRRKLKSIMVSLAWPLKETRARKLLGDILRYKSTITLILTTDSLQDIKDTKAKTLEIHDMMTESQREEVYQWLRHTDPSPNHHRAQKDYASGTGDWMKRSPEWIDWLEAKIRCLWIHGIPGAGKTVLMSHLIEQIKEYCDQSPNQDIAYAYYYCYYAHNQDETKPFLRWLISQLCRKAGRVPTVVSKLRKHGEEPSITDLLDALASILTRFEVVYVAVDAIDESNPREDLLRAFQDFVTESRFKKLQIIASSREYIDIERLMTGFSVPVSMNNPYVEIDIRRYIQSFLQSCKDFRRWPLELLHEVEEAVAIGAKGMFRWAVCQLDALKRLKCERDIVLNALKNLPETLEETYDRIFTLIPKEERLFVHHVLRWIAHHNDLWCEDAMPCEILIQAAIASTVVLAGGKNEGFYDQDTLREICGCLIEISPMAFPGAKTESRYTCHGVKFAHYTVFEYLESGRISRTASADHRAVEEISTEHLIEITLSEAQSVKSDKLLSTDPRTDIDQIFEAVYSNFTNYCMISGIQCLEDWRGKICRQGVLSRLAVDFLDPSKPHFEITAMIASVMGDELEFFSSGDKSYLWFWDIEWHPEVTTDARHTYFLLLCGLSDEYTKLAKNSLQEKDHKHLLQSRLRFRKEEWIAVSYRNYITAQFLFDGSILEVLAQQYSIQNQNIRFLLEIGAGLFDPSVILSLIGEWHIGLDSQQKTDIQWFLESGADPNLTDYITTPLQIATYCLNLERVSTLLQYGAKPSSTGCSNGAAWEVDTVMSYFNHLHGASPLRIIRKYTYIDPAIPGGSSKEDWILATRQKVERLLLQYGAEDISTTPQAAADEVKYNTPGWFAWAMASPHTQASTISRIDDHPSHPSADAPTITENSLSRPNNFSGNDVLPAFLTKILN